MHINILQILLIVIFTSLAYWVNATLNSVPQLNKVVSVLIVVVGVVLFVTSLFGGMGHITIGM